MSRLHLGSSDAYPLTVVLSQVREEITHLNVLFFVVVRSDFVVTQPVSNGFLRDVLLMGVKLSCEESRAAGRQFVTHSKSFIFNNNNHTLFTNQNRIFI